MTDSAHQLAFDDRVYLTSMLIEMRNRATPDDLQALDRLASLVESASLPAAVAVDFFAMADRYGPTTFEHRSRLGRTLAKLAPFVFPVSHMLRLAQGMSPFRLELLSREGPYILPREQVFPPFAIIAKKNGEPCAMTIELLTYEEAEAKLPQEIWFDIGNYAAESDFIFVAKDGDTVVGVSINSLKHHGNLAVLNGNRSEKFESEYGMISVCFMIARLCLMENLGLTVGRGYDEPLLANIRVGKKLWQHWFRFAGEMDNLMQQFLIRDGIVTHGLALKLREAAVKAKLLQPVLHGQPMAQNPQPAMMIPWESDAVYEVLNKLSPDYLARALTFFMTNYSWLTLLCQQLKNSPRFAELPPNVKSELLAYDITANPVMRAAKQFQELGRDDDALLSHRNLLERLGNMAALMDVLHALEPLAPPTPLVTEANPQAPGKLLRDGDYEPDLVYLSLALPSRVSWQARLNVIASYMQTYPRMHVVVDVRMKYAPLLNAILRKMGVVRSEHTEHIVLIDSSETGDKHPPQWARDAVLYMEPQEGPPFAVLRKATGAEFSGLRNCMDTVGIPTIWSF